MIVFIADDKRRDRAVKIIGGKKVPVTPLRILGWYTTDNVDKELARLYDDFRSVRVNSNWYDRDAVEMYLENRLGRA